MRLFISMLLSLAFSLADPSLGAVEEKSLSKNLKLEYQQLERTGDDNRYQIVLKDPHLYWMETSSMVPQLLAEINHKGLWKINVDLPANQASSFSEGSTQFIFNAPDTEGGQIDITLEGQVSKNISGNLSKITASFDRIKTGNYTQEDVLAILESIQQASLKSDKLKIASNQEPGAETLLENLQASYQHSEGVLPEEFKFSANATSSAQLALGNTTLTFPAFGKYKGQEAGQLAFPAWRTMAAFIHEPLSHGLPSISAKWTSQNTSNAGDSVSKFNFHSTRGDKAPSKMQWDFDSQAKYAAEFVRLLTNVKMHTPAGKEQNEGAASLYAWLTSPKVTTFLSLLPAETNFNFKGAIEYNTAPTLSINDGDVQLVWLGKESSGLKLTYTGHGQQNIGHQGQLQVQLAGGHKAYDYLVALYNAFVISLDPVLGKHGVVINQIEQEQKNELFKVLSSYVDDPKAVEKDMVFTIKDTPQGATIGGKSFKQFADDLDAVAQKYVSKQPTPHPTELNDQMLTPLPQESLKP